MSVSRGDTYLMPTGDGGFHLFIVCTEPCESGFVVLANLSSWKGDRCDSTVRFAPGVHPFVNVDSYVAYNFSVLERSITIEAGINQGRFLARDPFPESGLSQIEQGFMLSRFTPRKVKKYLAV